MRRRRTVFVAVVAFAVLLPACETLVVLGGTDEDGGVDAASDATAPGDVSNDQTIDDTGTTDAPTIEIPDVRAEDVAGPTDAAPNDAHAADA